MCVQKKNQFGAVLGSITPVVNGFFFSGKENNVVGNEDYGSTKITCVY